MNNYLFVVFISMKDIEIGWLDVCFINRPVFNQNFSLRSTISVFWQVGRKLCVYYREWDRRPLNTRCNASILWWLRMGERDIEGGNLKEGSERRLTMSIERKPTKKNVRPSGIFWSTYVWYDHDQQRISIYIFRSKDIKRKILLGH